jgi:redox-sensitive bicupin YhaK (pirin superfamily)
MSDIKSRPVAIVMQPTEAHEAEGVTIRRTIGSERMVLLDPILLLDHLQVQPTGEAKTMGFPRHPHRGIETLTYVLSGRVHHRDSLGNDSSVGTGGSQWMNAGSGIFHAEMLELAASNKEGVEAIQLWFNIASCAKMNPPNYAAATPETIPTIPVDGGGTVAVIAGEFKGVAGAFEKINAQPTYLGIVLPANTSLVLPAPSGQTTLIYLYRGSASFGYTGSHKNVTGPSLIVFGDGNTVEIVTSPTEEAHFIFVSARPFGEPVLQYRSLVMNTVDEMRQALRDLEQGTFTRHENLDSHF